MDSEGERAFRPTFPNWPIYLAILIVDFVIVWFLR